MNLRKIIRANRQLNEVLGGTPQNISELRNGTLLVEVRNEIQSNNILKLHSLNDISVKVEAHLRLNTVQGTIYYRNQPKYTEEDLINALREQQVTKIHRVKRRNNGNLEDTNIFILTFNVCSLPDTVHIGWTNCSVREYIPNPRRCYTCQ